MTLVREGKEEEAAVEKDVGKGRERRRSRGKGR